MVFLLKLQYQTFDDFNISQVQYNIKEFKSQDPRPSEFNRSENYFFQIFKPTTHTKITTYLRHQSPYEPLFMLVQIPQSNRIEELVVMHCIANLIIINHILVTPIHLSINFPNSFKIQSNFISFVSSEMDLNANFQKNKIVPDEHYGFDFAVYPINQQNKHTHSIALIKVVKNQSFTQVQKWIKICQNVNKQLWLAVDGTIFPIKLSSI